MTNSINPIYNDSPHALVTSSVNAIDGDDNADFNLEASIQFVEDGQATAFDLSSFIFVYDDLSNLEEQREALTREIAAANNLRAAVEAFHDEYLAQASKALDRLAALQASAQK